MTTAARCRVLVEAITLDEGPALRLRHAGTRYEIGYARSVPQALALLRGRGLDPATVDLVEE